MRNAIRLCAALILALAAPQLLGQTERQQQPLTDDAFIASLGRESSEPVDRARMARLFFSVAATLDGGKSSVRLLQTQIMVPQPSRPTALTLLEAGYEGYTRVLSQFQQSVSRLLDEPDSSSRLYRALITGQRACWHLDQHVRLLDTYNVAESELMAALSSLEACARFRTAAFQPRVEAIVADALVEPVRLREEIRDLKQELRDLQQLVEDLRNIEAGE